MSCRGAEGMFIIPAGTEIEAHRAKLSPGLWGFPLKAEFTFLRMVLESHFSELK